MALPLGDFTDPLAVQAIEPSIVTASPGEVLGATAGAAFDSLPTVSLLRQQQRFNESGPDTDLKPANDPRTFGSDVDAMAAERGDAPTRVTLQPEEANAKAKAAGAQGLTFDKPIADTTVQSVIDDHLTQQQRADVIARNGNSVLSGQVGRFVTGSLISLADPINVAAMMIPAAPEAFVAEKLAAAASAFERTAIRGAAGAVNGAVGMAALEPFNYAMSKADYNDWSAGDALRNIFMGAALGAGGHALFGGLFGREHLEANTSMEATRAAIGQAAEDRPVDVAGIVAQAPIEDLPPPAEGFTRLYRGEGGDAGGLPGQAVLEGSPVTGGWFTTDPVKAARYGDVGYIDVARDDLANFAQGHGGPDELVTDNPVFRDQMKPLPPDADTARAQAATAAKDMAERAMNPPADPVIAQAARINKATIDAAPQLAGDIDKDLAEVTKRVQEHSQRLQQEIASGRIIETQEMRDAMVEADHTENVGRASAGYAACLVGKGLT